MTIFDGTFDGRSVRRAGLVLGVVLALGYGIQQFPAAATAGSPTAVPSSVTGASGNLPSRATDPLSAPAQSALDAILGPHHSVVSASATYSQPISRLVTSYDPRHVATLSQASATAPGYRSSVTNNGVGQTVTNSSVPGGQVQRLTVAVVVDSSLRPAPKLAAIGRSVTAAMGLQPGRGDKLTVATLPMPAAGPAGSSPPLGAGSTSTSLTTTIAPYLRTGFGVTLAAVLLLILIADTLSRRRRARSARPASV